MDIHIRLATMEDVPALQELIQQSVSVLSTQYYTSKQIDSALTYIFGVDTQLIFDGTYFIAEVEKQLAGSGGWSKRRTLFGGDQAKLDGINPMHDGLLDAATESARVRAFYVHPRWSRRGIGSMILKSCEDAARNAGFHSIELVATLPGAPLYLASGYRTGGEMKIETPDGESLPAFRMSKSLK